jgi:hypothetical protein
LKKSITISVWGNRGSDDDFTVNAGVNYVPYTSATGSLNLITNGTNKVA